MGRKCRKHRGRRYRRARRRAPGDLRPASKSKGGVCILPWESDVPWFDAGEEETDG